MITNKEKDLTIQLLTEKLQRISGKKVVLKETKQSKLSEKEKLIILLKKYKIANYTINDDLSVDVAGDVRLSHLRLTKLPFTFGSVTGDFDCSNNQLTSLQGAPSSVTGNFDCSDNRLTSLQGAPSVIGNFYCSGNPTLSKQVIDKYLQSINDSRIEEVDELTEEKSMFNINPKLAFRLYDILKVKFPEVGQEFTESAFFTFLNENLNKTTLREDVNLEQQEIDDKLYVTGKEIETYLKSEFGSHNDEMNYEIEKWEDDKEETGQYISNDKVKFDKFIQDFSNKDLMRSEFVKYWNTMYPSAKEPLV